ncbi:MAG: thiosulfate oxidation carrier complex protein SoxZ [Hyphomicrobiaceae bacterium]
MATPTPRIRMPSTAKAGEVIEVKTLISHPMESGQRKDSAGKPIPRKIIKQFVATFNGKEVFRVDWHPAISANPYQSFFLKVPETGTFVFQWIDDDGSIYKAEKKVTVN